MFFPSSYSDSKSHYYAPYENWSKLRDSKTFIESNPMVLQDGFMTKPTKPSIKERQELAETSDKEDHQIFLKNEAEMKKRQKERDTYMKTFGESLLVGNKFPTAVVPKQIYPPIYTVKKSGIGLLNKGVKSDYDIYDTDFHGGVIKTIKTKRKTKRKTIRKTIRKNKKVSKKIKKRSAKKN
jgi:hypothetical protein